MPHSNTVTSRALT